jgi:uncharacterized protein YndB with AHSA1/START domain
MKPRPSGRVVPTADGRDLVLERTFRAPIENVWASITESERTARWIGPWTGVGAAGNTVELTMTAEEGASATAVHIDACDPPHHLRVTTDDAAGSWRLEAHLTQAGGITTLRFTHHLDDSADPGSIGPGWEYYLDRLVASRDDAAMPEWDDYYPAQKAYYEEAAAQA